MTLPPPLSADLRVRRLVAAYEALDDSAARLDDLLALYAAHARFADPFNAVQGRRQIRSIFEHMHTQVREPRFLVTESSCEGDTAWLRWDFSFGSGSKGEQRRRVDGASRIHFDADGRVDDHLDFWDPSRQVYEQLPILGAVLRAIRKRLAAPLAQIVREVGRSAGDTHTPLLAAARSQRARK